MLPFPVESQAAAAAAAAQVQAFAAEGGRDRVRISAACALEKLLPEQLAPHALVLASSMADDSNATVRSKAVK